MNDSDNPSATSEDQQDDWHDELVAYLDGEISVEERDRIEQRLAEDDAYRSQLVELERSWRLLDRLPTAEEDRDFTKSTIAMVAADLSSNGADQTPKVGGMRIPWGKLLATAAACAIGFAAVALSNQSPSSTSIQDIAVAQNLGMYKKIPNVDFLRSLHDAELFKESTGDDIASDWSQSNKAKEIRAGIEGLSGNEKTEIAKRREEFSALPEDAQELMRNRHNELVAANDAEELFAVLRRYREWIATLKSADQISLSTKNPEERLARVKELLDAGAQDIRVVTTPEELRDFYLNVLSPEERDQLQQMPPNEMRSELRNWYLSDRGEK